jgi:hypothetical protein
VRCSQLRCIPNPAVWGDTQTHEHAPRSRTHLQPYSDEANQQLVSSLHVARLDRRPCLYAARIATSHPSAAPHGSCSAIVTSMRAPHPPSGKCLGHRARERAAGVLGSEPGIPPAEHHKVDILTCPTHPDTQRPRGRRGGWGCGRCVDLS